MQKKRNVCQVENIELDTAPNKVHHDKSFNASDLSRKFGERDVAPSIAVDGVFAFDCLAHHPRTQDARAAIEAFSSPTPRLMPVPRTFPPLGARLLRGIG